MHAAVRTQLSGQGRARARNEQPRFGRFGGRHVQFYPGTSKAFIDDSFHGAISRKTDDAFSRRWVLRWEDR